MSDMSNDLRVKLLNLTLNGTSYAGMTDPYVSLHTADPTSAGTGAEVSTASPSAYVRVQATFDAASGTDSFLLNIADVTWAAAGNSWGNVGWIGLWDASSGGNMMYFTALDAAKTIDTGDVFKITTGNLKVQLV